MAEVTFGTSGSTGASKPIVRSEDQLLDDARLLVRAFPDVWGSAPTVVASIRPEHMYGALWRVRAPKIAGSFVDPGIVFSVEELVADKAKYGSFLFVTTPSFLEKALMHADFPMLRGAFTAVVTSGAPLRKETALAVHAVTGTCPLEIYGSTETGTVAWRRRVEGDEETLVAGVDARRLEDGRLEVVSPFAMTSPFVMNDIVEFTAPRKFLLLGRADRRVKILEKYVSLTAVEKAFMKHPYVEKVRVETFGEGVPRIGAIIVLSRAGVEELARGTSTSLCKRFRAELRAEIGDGAFPRRIRFVREFPVNEQGKTTVAAVRDTLAEWCREPATLEWRLSADMLSAKFVFPPDCECFQGHFPGYPVLPGVAQLYFLRHFAKQAFRDFPEAVTFQKLKFQKLVLPGREIDLTVRRCDGKFEFAMKGATGSCSSGTVSETRT